MLSTNTFQKVQIEKYRLNFLLNCRKLKRPPPSLRCTGFRALDEEERITMISEVETKSLSHAIKKKKREIKCLENMLKKSNIDTIAGLSKRKKIWWNKHFKKKIKFYRMKEATDWLNWPRKFISDENKEKRKWKSSDARKRRNLGRKAKLIQKKADDLIENGSVRVLVNIAVPAEAIAVLGLGLGFVPTPSPDQISTRLEFRRVANNIINRANREDRMSSQTEGSSVADESPSQNDNDSKVESFQLPAKLRQPNYFQSTLHAPNAEVGAAINLLNVASNQTA